MITCEHIANRVCSCDNCNRIMPFILKYKFIDVNETAKETTFVNLGLCEDCSNAVSNLFHKVMEEGKPFKYEKDEIVEILDENSVIRKPKAIEDLEIEELCSHCSFTIVLGPESLCEGRYCDEAYQKYLEEFEEEI
ncbi:hypothetical protein [Clostridium tagluense]|uniref:hypothetical protein n=1 Tax=Clostridium tagluense TaxID=360422 RepID=UPI001C6DF31B|nr:hypothetical protein [Clostridium tagluense]MBW9158898.1 hypothetical protein [Clostridium tagluense]WLC67126.1 hypothetical protein KTC93_08090 [Clostridium tagluense]